MPEELKTIKGEVEKKEKSYQEKAHAEKYRLNIGGVWVGMLKPGDEAFKASASKAMAWNIAEDVAEGEWVECVHEGQYKNIISLAIIQPEGQGGFNGREQEGGRTEAEKDKYWDAKGAREDRRSALHAAVAHAQGKDTKSENVVKVAEAFYKFIREAKGDTNSS